MARCLGVVLRAWWRDRSALVDWSPPFEHPDDVERPWIRLEGGELTGAMYDEVHGWRTFDSEDELAALWPLKRGQ